jgi:Fic family protein
MGRARGRYVTKTWTGQPGAQTTAERRGAKYRAFVPDPIANFELLLPGEIAGALETASATVRELNAAPLKLVSLEAVARHLLREESLASSRIEGLALGHRRIALADYDLARTDDQKAADIVGNIRAMTQAVELGADAKTITPEDVLAVHRTMLRFGEHKPIAGKWREKQGWVGGQAPTHAAYVPPPHGEVPGLMEDLCTFMNRTDMPALAQAAIAHAQFENIHPFIDGNGRVGRCLIQTVLRRRDLTPTYVPPVSVILAARRDHYFAGLEDFRGDGLYRWLDFFADATDTAAREAERLAAIMDDLQERWLGRFSRPPRADSAVRRVIAVLPAHPVLDVRVVMNRLGTSERASGAALAELEELGILKQVTKRIRGRVWECPDLFEVNREFEAALGDV